jgi:anti-sigma factor RsiW
MTDAWTRLLSAYVDGDLTSEDQAALTEHLEECAECAAALGQLRRVVAWAETYAGREPSRDVWPQIKEVVRGIPSGVTRMQPHRVDRRRFNLSVLQTLAAGVALAVVGVGGWALARATAPDRVVTVIDLPTQAGGPSVATAVVAAQKYGPAIADLERVLLAEQGALDSSTVRVLREQLVIIDRAMAEAQEALAQDPGSDYLADHYTGMMKKKLTVLRAAARSARAL